MFPLNAWYVACTPEDIDGKPLGRKICGKAIVFYRGPEGQVAAQEDFCPHRGAPLSLGTVEEGRLVCGYHGLEMGCDGKAIAMPGQRVRGFPCNKVYPVVERHGFIWVWPGEAELADADKIPYFAWAESPDWAFGGGTYHIKCDYRLMIDNLMDLTHEKYVHATSIGQKELDEAVPVTKVEDGVIVTRRDMENIKAPPFWQAAMSANHLDPEADCDRWQRCRYIPPSTVNIDVGVAYAGQGGFDAPAEVKASGIVVDLMTPETETTMWYFWGLARNFKADDAALTATIRENQGKVFLEDVAMLEGQQANLSNYPDRALLSLNTDQGGVRARRIIDQMLAEEQATRSDTAVA